MSKNEISKVAKQIQQATLSGTVRSLNRAVNSGKSKMAKLLSPETGLEQKRIKRRLKTEKASNKSLSSTLSVGTAKDVSLIDFKPKVVKIRKNKREYKGVTIKVGKRARQTVAGGFLYEGGRAPVVLIRKTSAPDSITAAQTSIFNEAAEAAKGDVGKQMVDSFSKDIQREIDFAMSKKIK